MSRSLTFVISVLLVLSGCGSSHSLDLQTVDEIQIRRPPGISTTFSPGDDTFERVIRWLEDNQYGWQEYLLAMPLQGTSIETMHFSIYVFGDDVYLLRPGNEVLIKKSVSSGLEFVTRGPESEKQAPE